MEVVSLVNSKHIPFYKIEQMVGDHEKGVRIRQVTLVVSFRMFIRIVSEFEHSSQILINFTDQLKLYFDQLKPYTQLRKTHNAFEKISVYLNTFIHVVVVVGEALTYSLHYRE